MAMRRSGQVKITCTLNRRSDSYRCRVKTPEAQKTVVVRAPASLRQAVDSPVAFDQAAHAALSFADDEGFDVASYADMGSSGWKISRR